MTEDKAAPEIERAAPRILPGGLIEPTVADMVFVALNTPGFADAMGVNICIWSDPGNGKTKTVEQVIEMSGRKKYGLVLTRVAPEDMTGVPFKIEVYIDRDGKPLGPRASEAEKAAAEMRVFTVKAPDLQFINISRDPRAVLMFDDATNSTPAVQAAALDIFLEKKFSDGTGGEVSLKHVPMVLMANHGEGASLTPLLSPVANRMIHVWMTSRDQLLYWTSHRKSQLTLNINKKNTLKAHWPTLEAKYWGMVEDYMIEVGYLGDKDQHGKPRLDAPWSMERDLPSNSKSIYGAQVLDSPSPQEFEEVESYAFATSRTWEFAVRWMAACEHFGVDDTRGVVGAIGVGKAKPFLEWRRVITLVEQTHQNKIDWSLLQPSEQQRISLRAAQTFEGDEQLTGMLRSFTKLRREAQGSEDIYHQAREHLIKRAVENDRMTPNQVFEIRRAWPDLFRQRAGAADSHELGAA